LTVDRSLTTILQELTPWAAELLYSAIMNNREPTVNTLVLKTSDKTSVWNDNPLDDKQIVESTTERFEEEEARKKRNKRQWAELNENELYTEYSSSATSSFFQGDSYSNCTNLVFIGSPFLSPT